MGRRCGNNFPQSTTRRSTRYCRTLRSGILIASLILDCRPCSRACFEEEKERYESMKTPRKHYKVPNGEVQLAVSETGQGQTLLFFNGGGATQVSWKRLIHELREPYRFVTFDFRNHGKTTRSSDVSFKGFLSDAEVIMDQVAGDRPLVVGWCLGADP